MARAQEIADGAGRSLLAAPELPRLPGGELEAPGPELEAPAAAAVEAPAPTASTPSAAPGEPSPAMVPSSAVASLDRPEDTRVRSLPIPSYTEVRAQCRVVTTFASTGDGCSLGLRRGEWAYFHAAAGFFETPSFERYARYWDSRKGPQSKADVSNTGITIIDPTRATVYFAELGPGVALWPSRQVNIHIEGGGFLGVVSNPASLAVETSDASGFALGAFAGFGASYRLPSRPWAIGFDYRITTVPYGAIGSAEDVNEYGVAFGHRTFGGAHSFGLTAILRLENDRSN